MEISPNYHIKATSQPKRTKVLLVCVFNKNSTLLTHDVFFNPFSRFGTVEKILIFDKSRIWKAFIEFASEIDADIAKEKLDNTLLLEDGSKMNVYYSNLPYLSFSSSNSGGVDYRLLRAKSNNMKSFLDDKATPPIPQFPKLYKNFTNPNPGKLINQTVQSIPDNDSNNLPSQEELSLNIEEAFYQKVEWKNTANEGITPETQVTCSLTASKGSEGLTKERKASNFTKDLKESLKKLDMIIAEKRNVSKKKGEETKQLGSANEEEKLEEKLMELGISEKNSAAKEMEESMKMQEIIKEAHIQLFDPSSIGQIDPTTYTNPLFLIENRKSRVIYCRGLEDESVNLEIIYNLFSNFGDILKIIFIRKKHTVLIEYESINYASYAREYMNNVRFMGFQLKIFYSNYNEINLKGDESLLGQEVFLGDENTFRLRKNRAISINPPSNIIHVSNLKKEACSYDNLLSFFSPFGKIEGIKIINMDTYKNMSLIKYSNLEDSLLAIVHMQNKEICGR